MARPIKNGIDYFSLDTNFLQDKKVKLIKGTYGAKGIVILLDLYCSIYAGNGYYINWDDDNCVLMSDDISCGITPELVRQVVSACIKRSIFNEELFNRYRVLTSPAIQRRYLRAVSTRNYINIYEEYFLLDINDKNDLPDSILNKLVFKTISLQKNGVNLQRNSVNLQINQQSKVKESKVKKSKVVVSLPMKNGGICRVTEEKLQQLLQQLKHELKQEELEIDVSQSLNKLRDYVENNPEKRRNDYDAYIKMWLGGDEGRAIKNKNFKTGINGTPSYDLSEYEKTSMFD